MTVNSMKDTGTSLFRALGDHPWVRAIGFDVLISAMGLCRWSVVSNADARSMIKHSIFSWLDAVQSAAESAASHVQGTTEDAFVRIRRSIAKALDRSATASARSGDVDAAPSDNDEDWYNRHSGPVKAHRGRPPKSTAEATRSGSTRRTRSSAHSVRSRSRTRKSVLPTKRNTPRRRSSRIRDLPEREPEHEDDDRRRTLSHTVGTWAERAEAASLTWGVSLLGGLGTASVAVFGAEEVN